MKGEAVSYVSYLTFTNVQITKKNVNISLSISLNMCFGCLKEPYLCDGSFKYPQYKNNHFHSGYFYTGSLQL